MGIQQTHACSSASLLYHIVYDINFLNTLLKLGGIIGTNTFFLLFNVKITTTTYGQ